MKAAFLFFTAFITIFARPIEFTDALGRVIKFEKLPVEKVVYTTYVENIAALKVWDKLVGLNRFAYDNSILKASNPEKLSQTPSLGAHSQVNMETMIRLKPDVVFMWAYKKDISEFIHKQDINVVTFKPISVDDVYNDLRVQGQILGVSQRAEFVISKMDEIFSYIQDKTKGIKQKKKAIWLWSTPTTVTSKDSVVGDILEKINAINPFSHLNSAYPSVDLESMTRANPDVILIWDVAKYQATDILNNNQLKHVKAVKNKRVIKAPDWNSWGPRCATLALWMAFQIYPEVFDENDVKRVIKEFNQDVFGVDTQ
ncbi:ABC transporter substrate-binding protein [Campylobacter sp.]|uniref:ABC transporter substrate-binding protein n=1 Tax=Campylobacter sp. TaxID=205 RepID=UPI0027064EDD|nr:ABC transporter substrate-binding protein [Campylobacter sp.]